ncbi:PREDICTED: uncharacterized protein LOC106728121 [Myotis brandtii]|uniref:uncharacterized protein LOC106728121 n=1 Tax=Myotis brandtii TaxID=109478 RepID=UPI00070475FF|nr:PREDICTED: uncharacterized protein LOC106728121 [Myotis brandtii]
MRRHKTDSSPRPGEHGEPGDGRTACLSTSGHCRGKTPKAVSKSETATQMDGQMDGAQCARSEVGEEITATGARPGPAPAREPATTCGLGGSPKHHQTRAWSRHTLWPQSDDKDTQSQRLSLWRHMELTAAPPPPGPRPFAPPDKGADDAFQAEKEEAGPEACQSRGGELHPEALGQARVWMSRLGPAPGGSRAGSTRAGGALTDSWPSAGQAGAQAEESPGRRSLAPRHTASPPSGRPRRRRAWGQPPEARLPGNTRGKAEGWGGLSLRHERLSSPLSKDTAARSGASTPPAPVLPEKCP